MRMYNTLFLLIFILGLPSTCYACEEEGDWHECNSSDECKGKFYTGQYTEWQTCGSDHYCPGNGKSYCCPTDYTSDPGAINEASCYKNVSCKYLDSDLTCKQYYGGNTICKNQGNDIPVHYESNDRCFTNYVNCDEFSNNCTDGIVSGVATWDSEQNIWNTGNSATSRCECITDYQSSTCSAKERRFANSNVIVSSFTVPIDFTQGGTHWCTQCQYGYYVNPGTDIQTFTGDDDCEKDRVCQCTKIPKGKYLETQCAEFNYDQFDPNQDICLPSNCPAGKTTATPGTIGEEQNVCSYDSNGTKFCDAKGCFNLGDVDSWDFSN